MGRCCLESLVERDKEQGHFSDELVDAMAGMIQQRWQPENQPQWLCTVHH